MGENIAFVFVHIVDKKRGYDYDFEFTVYENYDTSLRVLSGSMRVGGGNTPSIKQDQMTEIELQVMAVALETLEEAEI